MNSKLGIIVTLAVAIWLRSPVFAADYVLPYPSYMPGNRLYKVSRLLDRAKALWYWGTISSVKYHMSLSDKYLVEAKILFDYKQYLLAVDALERSNEYLRPIPLLLNKASQQHKNITLLQNAFADELKTHELILAKLQSDLPKEFIWRPEKKPPVTLAIFQTIQSALEERQRYRQSP